MRPTLPPRWRGDGSADPLGILDTFGRDLQGLPDTERCRRVRRAFRYWRRRGFPYPTLSRAEVEREFRSLERIDPTDVIRRNRAGPCNVGLRLANAFHPQMWHVPYHGRSRVDCFNNDRLLWDALQKCIWLYPHRRCWNAHCVRDIMRFYHGSRVANFRPAVARALYHRYSGGHATVLDFSAGFGGRMLGSLTLPRHYIGIDPEVAQVLGLRAMARALAHIAVGTNEIRRGCAEDLLRGFADECMDLVFSSPPYFDNERYSDRLWQSYRRFPTYPLWLNGFLFRVIEESHRVLRSGGILVLNVANLPGKPIADDASAFARGLFRMRCTVELLMSTRPQARANGVAKYRSEPIFVLSKC